MSDRPNSKRIATDDGKSERLHCTDEAGEPTRGTRSREGGRLDTEPLEGKAPDRWGLISVSTRLERIASRARESPDEVITTLHHFIDVEFLREAYERTRKDGAPGIDGQTAAEYARNLDENLVDLLERFKSGRYRAPPVRRVHIPKANGKTRPIGIPTFEDKVLQRAVSMVLEAIYEQEFKSCSYGFRPGRSAHQALEELRRGCEGMGGGIVIEVDIQGFFDSLVHSHLRAFLDLRVRDGVIRRAIDKWLKAGVLEDGRLSRSDAGTPQGGVISPLLANIYLHHVMDRWFEDEVKPQLSSRIFLVRYADDLVIACRSEEDARRVFAVLPKRFGKYGLTLHPEKTRIVTFRRPRTMSEGKGTDDDGAAPGTFDFLGFTHYWSRGPGGYRRRRQLARKTASDRLAKAVKAIEDWCRRNRHRPLREQRETLVRKIRGHGTYYGLPENEPRLRLFARLVATTWRKWLNRRSQRRALSWARFLTMLQAHPLPGVDALQWSNANAAAKP